MSEHENRNTAVIPTEIPAGGQDWANYIGRSKVSDVQIQSDIQLVLEFENRLDIERMRKAIRLSVDAEPVLGCSFIECRQPYWKRLDDLDEMEWCSFEQAGNRDEAVQSFLLEPLEPELRQVQAKIIRSEENDILCLKLNHTCSDGGGVKEYFRLLAEIYTHLCEDDNYLPASNVSGKRDSSSLFRALGIKDPRMAFSPQLSALKPAWAFPYHGGKPEKLHISIKRLGKDKLDDITSYAKERKATINDIILTAYYRALFDMLSPGPEEPMDIHVTADLRRYLPDRMAETICNLSGIAYAKAARVEGEAFDSTLNRVSLMMRDVKSGSPGIHSAASMELMRSMGFEAAAAFLKTSAQKAAESGRASPLLSNMGIIAQYPLRFGDNIVKDAYMVTPPMCPPGFMLGASTYNGILTLTVSWYEPAAWEEEVEKFLDLVENELLSCSASMK